MFNIILNVWPTTVEGWVGLIVLISGLVGAVAKLIPTVIKLHKATAKMLKDKNFKLLVDIAKKAMVEAQASGQSGEEKQKMVIRAIKAGAEELKIEINDEDIEALIESIKELKAFFKEMKAADSIAKK